MTVPEIGSNATLKLMKFDIRESRAQTPAQPLAGCVDLGYSFFPKCSGFHGQGLFKEPQTYTK